MVLLKSETIPCRFPVTLHPKGLWGLDWVYALSYWVKTRLDQALAKLEKLERLPPGGLLSGGPSACARWPWAATVTSPSWKLELTDH